MKPRLHLFICRNHREPEKNKPSCRANGSDEVLEAFAREIKARNLTDEIQVTKAGCLHQCEEGPIAVVYPEGIWYAHLTPEDVKSIVEEHFIGGRPLQDKLLEKVDE